MKKLLIFTVALAGVLCFASCEKKHSSRGGGSSGGLSRTIETSYWRATLSNGYLFYVGIEELTEEDKNNAPFEFNDKYTNTFTAEIQDSNDPYYNGMPEAQLSGVAYKENNQIIVQSIVSGGGIDIPKIYDYDGKNLSCVVDGDTVQFAEITEDEWYSGTEF